MTEIKVKSKIKTPTKTLVIVESPNKIKTISKYLGEEYIIKASVGHVEDLATGEGTRNLGINIEKGFEPIYKINQDKIHVVDSIIDASTLVKTILIASDQDREGEAIAFSLAKILKSSGKPIHRVFFTEMVKNKILEGVADLKEIDKNLVSAQQARRVLDRIVGFLASQVLRDIMPGHTSLSAGRVQSVATRLIVDREREIENFKPDEYWNISTNLYKDPSHCFFAKYTKKVTNKDQADKIKKDLELDTFKVVEVEAKEYSRKPFPPLITSTLQQVGASRYGLPVKRTMAAAQSLYEKGFITYMRTDSIRISPEKIEAVREFLDQNNYPKPKKPNFYATKDAAQDAHEAIRPTDVFKKPEDIFVDEEQRKVYKLIWETFVASQMSPAVYDTMTALIKSSSGHELKASGRALKSEGWLKLVNIKEADDEGTMLPLLSAKDSLQLTPPNVVLEQKFTQPPSKYTDGSLVKELTRREIGRPATYASITELIKNRSYVEMKGKVYCATELGKQVIDKLVGHFKFMDYDYTAEMEKKLDDIANGKLSYIQMLTEFFDLFQKECSISQTNDVVDYGITCVCGQKMILKSGKFGPYMRCVSYPACKKSFSVNMVDGKPVKNDQAFKIAEGVFCPLCKGPMMKISGKFGQFYNCQDKICNGKRKVPYGKKCPKCGDELFITIFGSVKKLGCMAYPNCKHTEDFAESESKPQAKPYNKTSYAKKSYKKK